jgi:hypothetical protein
MLAGEREGRFVLTRNRSEVIADGSQKKEKGRQEEEVAGFRRQDERLGTNASLPSWFFLQSSSRT